MSRKSNTESDELAIFPRYGTVVPANNLVQAEPRVEFRGCQLAHFPKKSQIGGIMVVFAHLVLLLYGKYLNEQIAYDVQSRHSTGVEQDG